MHTLPPLLLKMKKRLFYNYNGENLITRKCRQCGGEFLTDSETCFLCSAECVAERTKANRKKYLKKYLKKNLATIGYAQPYYKAHRGEILLQFKAKKMRTDGKPATFKCAVCGKVCDYIKDGYRTNQAICKSARCRKVYYSRNNKKYNEARKLARKQAKGCK